MRPWESDLLPAFRCFLNLAVHEPFVSHFVKIAPCFIVDEEIKVVPVQFGHLALGKEVGSHPLCYLDQTRLPDLPLELSGLLICGLIAKQVP